MNRETRPSLARVKDGRGSLKSTGAAGKERNRHFVVMQEQTWYH